MKKLLILLLIFTSLAYADVTGATGGGSNITGCKKLSSWYFCQTFFGTPTQAVNVATLCQTANNGDAAKIDLHYTNDPDFPPRPYYAIYWAKCLEFEYGNAANSTLGYAVAEELGEIFDNPVSVSGLLDAEDEHVRAFVVDAYDETVYSTLWTADGALVEMEIIDPEHDEDWMEAVTREGLTFTQIGE